jgi:manganese/iron transport system permease protein
MLLIPAAAAKLVSQTFVKSIKISAFFGGVASVTGLYLSYYFNLPSGPTMSLVASGIFVLSFLSKKLMSKPKLINP